MAEPSPSQSLARKAKAGDRAAFDALCQTLRPRLETLLSSRIRAQLKRQLDLDDLVQETFARALESLQRFRGAGDDDFFAWVTGIAKHVLLKAVRRLGRGEPLRLKRELAGSDPSPSQALRRQERLERLKRSIDSLSPEHRKVVRLVRIEGLSLEEAARELDRSPEAVRKLLWRALKELRKAFGDTESLHLPQRGLDPGEGGHGN